MNVRLATILSSLGAATIVVAAGCSSGPQNAPQPTVTQLEAAATDAFLTTAVKTKLIAVDIDSATALGVHVVHGVASLTGSVRSPAARSRDVAAARTVPGIVAVRDELTVNPNLPNVRQQVGDAALAGRIAAAIFTQTGSTQVRVTVRDGVVTLHGTVTDPKTRTAALDTARNTSGVRRVIDQMSS